VSAGGTRTIVAGQQLGGHRISSAGRTEWDAEVGQQQAGAGPGRPVVGRVVLQHRVQRDRVDGRDKVDQLAALGSERPQPDTVDA